MGRHVSDQCFGTPASATTLLLCGQARLCSLLYRTFGVPIVLCSSHSLLSVYAGKYLYIVYMNNMIHEIKSTKLCYVVYTSKHLYDKNMKNEQEESIRNKFCSVMYYTYGYLLYKISI